MNSNDVLARENNVQFVKQSQHRKNVISTSNSMNSRSKVRKSSAAKRIAIVWHKVSDLRFHDHEPLVGAHMNKNADFVLHVHLRGYETKISRVAKLPRICPIRAQFWQESLLDLDHTLRTKNKQQYLMVIDVQHQNADEQISPAQIVSQIFVDLISKLKIKLDLDVVGIYTHDDFCSEEIAVLKKLNNMLQNLEISGQKGIIQLVRYWGGLTVHHLDDVRKIFEKGGIPDLYKPFQNSLKRFDLNQLRPPINLSSGRRLKPAPKSEDLIQSLVENEAKNNHFKFDEEIQTVNLNLNQLNQNQSQNKLQQNPNQDHNSNAQKLDISSDSDASFSESKKKLNLNNHQQKQNQSTNENLNACMWFTVILQNENIEELDKQLDQLSLFWKITPQNQDQNEKIQYLNGREQVQFSLDQKTNISNLNHTQTQQNKEIDKRSKLQINFDKKFQIQKNTKLSQNSDQKNSPLQLNKYEKYWKNKGGEKAALQYLTWYIWDNKEIRQYVGASDSMHPGKRNAINSTSNLSPWLAFGNLSPRLLMFEIQRFEKNVIKNRSTYWIWHELVFRDFFRFSAKFKYKSKMFKIEGPFDLPQKSTQDQTSVQLQYSNEEKRSKKSTPNNSPKSVINNREIFQNEELIGGIKRSVSLGTQKSRKFQDNPRKNGSNSNLQKHRRQSTNNNNLSAQKFMNWRVPSEFDKKAQQDFERWITGNTGYPFIDAGMRELAHTGHMSHLHRQTCASFLVRDLQIDWRFGAEWFEYCLLDYTPDANWGNWVYRVLPRPQLLEDAEWPICMHEKRHLMTLEILSWPYVHDQHLVHTNTWVPELGEYFGRTFLEDEAFVKECIRSPWRSLEKICKNPEKYIVNNNNNNNTQESNFALVNNQTESNDEIYFSCNELSDSDSEQCSQSEQQKISNYKETQLQQSLISKSNGHNLGNSQFFSKQSNFQIERILVEARRDSPYWFTSVNRVNWPEYQQFMTGYAWTVNNPLLKVPSIKSSVQKKEIFPCEIPDYPLFPIVPPLNLEVDLQKIPIDHSWG